MNSREVKKDNPRVIFIGSFPDKSSEIIGGIRNLSEALLENGLADRWDLTLIDSTTRSVPPPGTLVRAGVFTTRLFLFLRALTTSKPHAVVMFASGGLSFIEKGMYALLARIAGIPASLWIVSGSFMNGCRASALYRGLARILLKAPVLVLCQGPTWQRFFAQLGVPESKCRVIPPWIRDTELHNLRAHGSRPGAPVSIVFVGWIEETKGVVDLIEAVRILDADPELPEFRVSLLGGGGASASLSKRIKKFSLESVVELNGWVEGNEKRRLLLHADVFALPSHGEGLPMAMLEAMALGLPVVVTPVGSIPDYARDGVHGFHVEVRNANSLAGGLGKLIRDSALRQRFGDASYATARGFTAAAAVASLDSTIRDIIDPPR